VTWPDEDLERVCVGIVLAVLDRAWDRLEALCALRSNEALVFGLARLALDSDVHRHGVTATRQQYRTWPTVRPGSDDERRSRDDEPDAGPAEAQAEEA
jgi:hypothetical protein